MVSAPAEALDAACSNTLEWPRALQSQFSENLGDLRWEREPAQTGLSQSCYWPLMALGSTMDVIQSGHCVAAI